MSYRRANNIYRILIYLVLTPKLKVISKLNTLREIVTSFFRSIKQQKSSEFLFIYRKPLQEIIFFPKFRCWKFKKNCLLIIIFYLQATEKIFELGDEIFSFQKKKLNKKITRYSQF